MHEDATDWDVPLKQQSVALAAKPEAKDDVPIISAALVMGSQPLVFSSQPSLQGNSFFVFLESWYLLILPVTRAVPAEAAPPTMGTKHAPPRLKPEHNTC